MSELSFMEKLLDGAEIEWVELGEVVDFSKGKSLPKARIVEGGENKCIHYGELFTQYPAIISEVKSRTNQSLDDSVLSMANDVLMPTSDVTPNGLATASCLSEAGVILGGDILVIRGGVIDGKYLSHFIRKSKSKIMQMVKGSTVYHIYAKDLGKLLIPIPCPDNPEKSLEIQAEIVRILDAFTAMTAELTAELNLRKQQYNHYRDQLLSFEEGGVEWKTLGEVLKMRAGHHISASKIMPNASNEYAHPCFGGNGIRGFVENKSHDGNHLLIGRQGALCGNVKRINGKFYATEHAVVVTNSDEIDIDWAFHMLTVMNLNQYASQSAQPGLAVGKLQGLKIPLPSLAKQKRTAYILDKFDALTNSITEGLPREIELRQKQYEYYRDLLLSFPKENTLKPDNGAAA